MKKSLLIRGPQRTVLIGLLLAFVTLIPYWQVRNHGFINLDDNEHVTENHRIHSGLNPSSVKWAFTTTYPDYWHPLPWLSLMLDHHLFGLDPAGYHITNLFLHIVNTLLLFFLLNRMTGALWRSAVVAALFALHPLHVESVAWITERKGLLSATFCLLTILSYAFYVHRPGSKRYLLILLCFALGLLSKPMLITLPFVLLLLDYWPLLRFGSLKASFSLLIEKIPLLFLSIASVHVTLFLRRGEGIIIPLEARPMLLRIENALVSYVKYMGKMIWPSDLAVFYPYPETVPLWQAVGAAGVLVALSLFVFHSAKRHPYLVSGWLWYLGTLLPVIGLVQWGLWPAMADRFTYIPLIGLFIMITWGVSDLFQPWRFSRPVLMVSAWLVLLFFTLATQSQAGRWKDSRSLFEHVLKVTPRNHLAHNNLGEVLLRQGNLQEALFHFHRALDINPAYDVALNNLGSALSRQGMLRAAIPYFLRALQIRPHFKQAHSNLGLALAKTGKLGEAIPHYEKALMIDPDYPEAHHNLGLALAALGHTEKAIAQFQEALRVRPKYAEVHNDLGSLLARKGNLDEALFHFSEALRLKPDYTEAGKNLSLVIQKMDR
ncbi:MAG: tetratricopeptide repeat protein [Pseudomonadota bacterium]